jgi:ABC-type antimicrobial peptide transport system permease subunit
LLQFPFSDVRIAVDAATPAAAVAALRTAVRSAAPEVPIGSARTWGDRFGDRTAEPKLLMTILVMFGAFAALLAALGVYGLLAWSVSIRTRELAIRVALGARPWSVGGAVIRDSALLAAGGLIIGLVAVRALSGILSAVLYEVTSTDARATIAAATLLAVTALVACVPAAIRAMRIEPVHGLRVE